MFATVDVKVPDSTETTSVPAEMPVGTAFFVLYPDVRGGPDFNFCYIVTAKHVLRQLNNGGFLPSVKVRLNLRNPTPDQGFDFVDIPVADQQGNLLWLHNRSNERDEAVAFPLLPDTGRFDFKAIKFSDFADDEVLKKENVGPGDTLFFVGLLPQFYGKTKNFPVLRRGSLALLADEDVPTPVGLLHGYIAEVASWPGNSGSPVFLNLSGFRGGGVIAGGGPRFLGIVISQYNNSWSVDVTKTAAIQHSDPASIGLAFVLPASDVVAILNGPDAQKLRDIELSRRQNKN